MPIGILFWFLMILWFLFWGLATWNPSIGPYGPIGHGLLLFILLALLGWHDFGPVLH